MARRLGRARRLRRRARSTKVRPPCLVPCLFWVTPETECGQPLGIFKSLARSKGCSAPAINLSTYCISHIILLQHLYQYAINGLVIVRPGARAPYQEKEMSDPIVFGFPRSTFVQIVRLVLTHKNVSYTFRDLEPEMGKPTHLALH